MKSVTAFVFRVLAWAVVAYTAWHFAAQPISTACGWMGARLVAMAAPAGAVRTEARGHEVIVAIAPAYETARRNGMKAGTWFEASASPMTYSWGLPFFLALMLASRPRGLAWKALSGSIVVLLAAAAGVALDVLVQLIGMPRLASGEEVFAFGRAARESIALGYQLAALILPPLVPAMLWIALDWRGVMALAARGRDQGSPGRPASSARMRSRMSAN